MYRALERRLELRRCCNVALVGQEEAPQIILHVSKGDIETGFFNLTDTISQVAAGLLLMHKH
jgi:hypothetical protein